MVPVTLDMLCESSSLATSTALCRGDGGVVAHQKGSTFQIFLSKVMTQGKQSHNLQSRPAWLAYSSHGCNSNGAVLSFSDQHNNNLCAASAVEIRKTTE